MQVETYWDDDDGFFASYRIEGTAIAPNLRKLTWRKTSFNPDGSVYFIDSLRSVNWLDPNHEGQIQLMLFENTTSTQTDADAGLPPPFLPRRD